MPAQTAPPCFIFEADLIELLHHSADQLRVAVETSFPNCVDLETATDLINATLIDSVVSGERNASALRLAVLSRLQSLFPRLRSTRLWQRPRPHIEAQSGGRAALTRR
jgi:hypothetical protein